MSRKFPDLRASFIIYLLIVVAGLGAAGAHALWSQSGTVAMGATAGIWAPTGKVANVICTRNADSAGPSIVTVAWDAVDADRYRLVVATTNGGASTIRGSVVQEGTRVSATLELGWGPQQSGQYDYTLSVTPEASAAPGQAAIIEIKLTGKKKENIECTAGQ